jgi:hypothetical protein
VRLLLRLRVAHADHLNFVLQSLRRDPQGRALERPMLSADDEQPAEPAPARQASHRALSFARPPALSNLPEADEAGGDALESHRSSVARLRAAEERLRQAQAMREAETLKKDQVLKNMLPHDRLKIQREERVRARWTETQQTWSRFRTRAAKKLGRDESQLVVAHAEEFRCEIGMYFAVIVFVQQLMCVGVCLQDAS